MNLLTLSQIDAAVDAAFQSALALAQPQRIAPQQISDNCTLRTDIYAGPMGYGFVVVASLTIYGRTFLRTRQHGPETWRERNWNRNAIHDALDADYDAQVAKGIEVNGITLAAEKDDRDKFAQLIAFLREAEELQPDDAAKATFMASSVILVDIHNAVHELTVTEARQLIVQYGQAANALWAGFAQRRAALS